MTVPEGERCDAFVLSTGSPHRCKSRATHRHIVEGGSVHLCGRHAKMLDSRTRHGSTAEVLEEWGYGHGKPARPPAKDHLGVGLGETYPLDSEPATPLTRVADPNPSPPLPVDG